MTPGARVQAAVEVLDAIESQNAPADVVAGAYFKSRRYIGAKDRAAVAGLVYAVLRHRAQLDWWRARVGGGRGAAPVAWSPTRARVITWLLTADGWTLDRLKDAFDGGRFRPASLTADELAAAKALAGRTLDHDAQPPWVRRNYPEWLHAALLERFGPDVDREMEALASPAPLDLRVNALKATRDDALARLRAEGLEVERTTLSPWGLRVQGRPPLGALAAFREGVVEVQDEGSQLVALLVEAAPGLRVCDFCAGAGGKTLAMAASMANRGHIVACDVSGRRLEGATRRLRRAGVFNVEQRALSSERDPWVKRHRAKFDRVLVDAPCTGTGTWRRNPDAKWSLKPDDLAELVALQRRILDSAARLVKPGGRLVYATCSVLADENERQAARFAAAHPEFAAIRINEVWTRVVGGEAPADEVWLRLSPARHGTDGFFVAAFEKCLLRDGERAES